jgi:hypothetical protein
MGGFLWADKVAVALFLCPVSMLCCWALTASAHTRLAAGRNTVRLIPLLSNGISEQTYASHHIFQLY